MSQSIEHKRSRPSVTAGVALMVLGIAALTVQASGLWRIEPRWPLAVIVPGLILLFISAIPASRWGVAVAVAGSIVTTVGGILLYQQSTDDWASWAYAWTLIPVAAGVATTIYGIAGRRRELAWIGVRVAAVGGVLFVSSAWFFESLFTTGRPPLDITTWGPLALIATGLLVVASNLRTGGRWIVPNEEDTRP